MKMWEERLSDKRMLYRESLRDVGAFWEGHSPMGIVTTAHYKATAAGVEILAKGGNAIDAAVAASLAMGVADPAGSGLGGMAVMLIHLSRADNTFILSGPCRAPLAATPEKLEGIDRKFGYKAVAVPTHPAVIAHALETYGTMDPARVLAPAIRLAEAGLPRTVFQYGVMKNYFRQICRGNAASLLFGPDKKVSPAGTVYRQPVLAKTLKRMAAAGFEDFYTGEIGRKIARDMMENEGFITMADLVDIPWPEKVVPVKGRFGRWEILSMPPPGGGTALIEMLNLFEELSPAGLDPDSPEAAILFANIIRKVRRDRRKYRLVSMAKSKGPDLLGKEYAKEAAAGLRDRIYGPGETTHLNVADSSGNMVAMTQSIERSFGSKMAAGDLGVLYNGYMQGFKIQSQRHPHYLRPGAVARSNASPSIVFEKGKPVIAIGSTGSERMVSGIFQVLVRMLSQEPFEAVKAPRLHCNPEGQVFLEKERFPAASIDALEKKGFEVIPYDAWAFSVGGLQMAYADSRGYHGVADPRRDGAADGPDK